MWGVFASSGPSARAIRPIPMGRGAGIVTPMERGLPIVQLAGPSSGRPPISRSADRRVTAAGLTAAGTFLAAAVLATLLPDAARRGTWLPLHLALAGGAGTAIASMMPFFAAALAAAAPVDARLRRAAIGAVAIGALLATLGVVAGAGAVAVLGGLAYLAGLAGVGWATFAPLHRGLGPRGGIVAVAYGAGLAQLAAGGALGTATGGGAAMAVAEAGARLAQRPRLHLARRGRHVAPLPADGAGMPYPPSPLGDPARGRAGRGGASRRRRLRPSLGCARARRRPARAGRRRRARRLRRRLHRGSRALDDRRGLAPHGRRAPPGCGGLVHRRRGRGRGSGGRRRRGSGRVVGRLGHRAPRSRLGGAGGPRRGRPHRAGHRSGGCLAARAAATAAGYGRDGAPGHLPTRCRGPGRRPAHGRRSGRRGGPDRRRCDDPRHARAARLGDDRGGRGGVGPAPRAQKGGLTRCASRGTSCRRSWPTWRGPGW